MATRNRDVRLGVEIETAGEQDIRRLADEVRRLAREGGDAAPQFAAFAEQLDRLGDRAGATDSLRALREQLERLGQEQTELAQRARLAGEALTEQKARADALRTTKQQLAEAVRVAELELTKARGAAQELAKGYTSAEKQTAQYTSKASEAAAAVTAANVQLVSQRQELARLTPQVREAEAAERRLAEQFTALNAQVKAGDVAVRQRTQSLQQAEAAALAAGASTDDLTAADQELLAAVQRITAETNKLTAEQRDNAAVSATLADLDEQNAAAIERRMAAQIRATQEYEKEQLALREAAEAAQRKAQADFDAAAAYDDLAAAQARGKAALESEIAALRDSEQFIERYERGLREAAAAQEALGAAEGAEAMRRLERAAQEAFNELRSLTQSLKAAEDAAEQFAAASDRAAAAGTDDVAAMQARRAAAEALIESERRLTIGQSELAQQRNANRAALIAEAQAVLSAARAADESREATARFVREARQAGDVLESAFGKTGVRSLNAIEAEIQDVERAMTLLERRFRAGAISADDLNRATGSAAVRLRTLQAEIKNTAVLPGAFEVLNGKVNDLIGKFGSLTAAVGTVGIVVKPVIDATVALEQMRRVLTTVSGSAEAAEQGIRFLRETSNQSGQVFTEVGQSYAKFAASALQSGLTLEQTQEVFRAVSLAAGNLGLSSEQAKRALEALSQIAAKGVVNMEELRQQLGDALPGVLPLLAKELGITQAQLVKLVETGGLLAFDAIPAIGRSLATLAPVNNGNVDSMVAEWNRFKNAVFEAGTTIVEGPIGKGAGLALSAISEIIRSLAFVAVSASEGIGFLGRSIGATAAFIAGGARDFDNYKATISSFAEQAGQRIREFGETAAGAARKTTDVGTAASEVGESVSALTVRLDASIKSAEQYTRISERMAQVAEKEAESVGVLVRVLTDEREAADRSADAAAKVLAAREEAARAAAAEAEALRAAKTAQLEKAGADERALAGIGPLLQKLDQQIASADAFAAKQQALADKARVVADAASLAAEKIGDQSDQLDALVKAVEGAQVAYDGVTGAFKRGKATTEELAAANQALARAKNLLRDAVDDVSEALEQQLGLMRAEAKLAEAQLQYQLEVARALRDQAVAQGNQTTARLQSIRVQELEQQIVRLGINLKADEARATQAAILKEYEALEASGELTEQKKAELEVRLLNARAAMTEAAAKEVAAQATELAVKRTGEAVGALGKYRTASNEAKESTRGLTTIVDYFTGSIVRARTETAEATKEIQSLGTHIQTVIAGFDTLRSVRERNASVRSTLTWEGRDSNGNLDPNFVGNSGGSFYTPPPDNSGDWVWQATASRPGGEWVLTPAASQRRFAEGEQSRGLVPVTDPSGSVRYVMPRSTAGGPSPAPAPAPPASAPAPVSAPAPAPAPTPSRVIELRLQVSGQSFSALAEESTAEAMLRAIEDAQRLAGGR